MPLRLRGPELEAAILDTAAALFAARGFKATSVQAVADVTGYSKGAILARHASKEKLFAAVTEYCFDLVQQVLGEVDSIESGATRDARAVEALTGTALSSPGFVSLLVAAATTSDPVLRSALDRTEPVIWEIFTTRQHEMEELERRARVVGAIAAIAALVSISPTQLPAVRAKPLITATALATLRVQPSA